ncbi:hypothetical protein DY000_02034789 [Brassica cretica]|uniref:Phytocyanin domain-containing protein n=1 Tax=Brassica cretica TaxID=69181 RepID=A0ABQ7DYC1_BRACR|nr:hypothetical protein DY000_02034789 [Brassica cretica]
MCDKSTLSAEKILVALFGVSFGGTVHKVGNSSRWTMVNVNYEAWATSKTFPSSKTFQVGDSLVFEYNNVFHNVIEVTHNDFELCQPSKPLAINQTGTKTSNPLFPVSMGHVAAPVPRPVRSPSTSSSSPSPVSNGTLYQIGPSPAPHRAASIPIVWIGLSIFFLLSLLILG